MTPAVWAFASETEGEREDEEHGYGRAHDDGVHGYFLSVVWSMEAPG